MHDGRKLIPAVVAGLTLGIAGTVAISTALAAPTKKETPKESASEVFEQGKQAAADKDWPAALELFRKADKLKPRDPEIINALAFTTRKTGKLEEARELYLKALGLRPRFPEAREYLGECYLELAKEQLAMLKEYGDDAKEEYEALASAFKRMAAEVEGGSAEPAQPEWDPFR